MDANPTSNPRDGPQKEGNNEIIKGQGLSEEEYRVDHRYRGKAVIFNHFSFDGDLKKKKTRYGSEEDVRRLEEELKSLGFDVKVQEDKTVEEIQNILHNVAIEDHSDEDCLIVVVMSHGGKLGLQTLSDEQFSYQKIEAKDGSYNEKELFEQFEEQKSITLAGKPKIFFIQACREGEDKSRSEKSPWPFTSKGDISSTQAEDDNDFMYFLPKSADFLVFRSTVDGTISHRDPKTGAHFIQTLCQELKKNRSREEKALLDLESLLINVKREFVVSMRKNSKLSQMPCVHSTLIRKLYLKPK